MSTVSPPRTRHVFVWVLGSFVALLLIIPTLVVIPISFTAQPSFLFPPPDWSLRWYEAFFTKPAWYGSLQRSLVIALVSSTLATVIGTAAAIGLNRWRSRRLALVGQGIIVAPILIPGIVLAIGIYYTFTVLGIVGTPIGLVTAHTALGLPYVLISVGAALTSVDPNLAPAAESLGASKIAVALKITLPLVVPGVLAGYLLAFVTSFDEVLITLFIKSPFLETLPVRMYTSVLSDIDPTIAAASTVVLVITTLILILGTLVLAQRNRRLKGKK